MNTLLTNKEKVTGFLKKFFYQFSLRWNRRQQAGMRLKSCQQWKNRVPLFIIVLVLIETVLTGTSHHLVKRQHRSKTLSTLKDVWGGMQNPWGYLCRAAVSLERCTPEYLLTWDQLVPGSLKSIRVGWSILEANYILDFSLLFYLVWVHACLIPTGRVVTICGTHTSRALAWSISTA